MRAPMHGYILIAEDDNDINRMLSELLSMNGYSVVSAFSGTEALIHIKNRPPAAVILDLMLPGMSGATRISLLRAGADDYLVKPFDTEELLARLEAVLRRSSAQEGDPLQKRVLRYKDIVMYPADFSAFVGGEELSLTRREYLILELLMRNPGKVLTKSNIFESVWNEEFLGEDNAVNVHISNIRQKLSRVHPGESYIQTVWGIGFKMK